MEISKTAPLQVDARIKCPHKVSCPTGGGSNYPYYIGAIYIIVHIGICIFTQNNNNIMHLMHTLVLSLFWLV